PLALENRPGERRAPKGGEEAPRQESEQHQRHRSFERAESKVSPRDQGERADKEQDERSPPPGGRPVTATVRAEHQDRRKCEQPGWSLRAYRAEKPSRIVARMDDA